MKKNKCEGRGLGEGEGVGRGGLGGVEGVKAGAVAVMGRRAGSEGECGAASCGRRGGGCWGGGRLGSTGAEGGAASGSRDLAVEAPLAAAVYRHAVVEPPIHRHDLLRLAAHVVQHVHVELNRCVRVPCVSACMHVCMFCRGVHCLIAYACACVGVWCAQARASGWPRRRCRSGSSTARQAPHPCTAAPPPTPADSRNAAATRGGLRPWRCHPKR